MLRLSLALPTPMLESPSPTVNNPIDSISMATHWLPFHHLKDANVWFRVSIHYLAPKLSETFQVLGGQGDDCVMCCDLSTRRGPPTSFHGHQAMETYGDGNLILCGKDHEGRANKGKDNAVAPGVREMKWHARNETAWPGSGGEAKARGENADCAGGNIFTCEARGSRSGAEPATAASTSSHGL